MRRYIPVTIICLLILGGCHRPQPVVGSLHSVAESGAETRTYSATCFPIGDGIWVSTCHRKNERIIQGIAQGTTEIEVAGERFPVIDARFSKDEDYCLVAIGDQSHTGFTLSSKRPEGSDFKILLSEGENRSLSARLCPWPKAAAQTKGEGDSKADDSSAPTNTLFPLIASERILAGSSGSPVLNNGKVVGLVMGDHEGNSYCILVIPSWTIFPELSEMVAELKHGLHTGQTQMVQTSQPVEASDTMEKE